MESETSAIRAEKFVWISLLLLCTFFGLFIAKVLREDSLVYDLADSWGAIQESSETPICVKTQLFFGGDASWLAECRELQWLNAAERQALLDKLAKLESALADLPKETVERYFIFTATAYNVPDEALMHDLKQIIENPDLPPRWQLDICIRQSCWL